MKISTTLRLILVSLLHVTWVSSSDSCPEMKTLPIDFTQINGLWNIKSIASRDTLSALEDLNYAYVKISVGEKGGTLTQFFNPISERMVSGPFDLERVSDGKETLAYKNVFQKESGLLLTFLQVHSDVLIINYQSSELIKTSILFVRSSTYPESELEHFKDWYKCKELTIHKEFNITDYAQKCYGLFQQEAFMEETEDKFTSWHLVAKSTSSMDLHYYMRIFYTARLEISKKEGEYTLKEIISTPIDSNLLELKFGKSNQDDVAVMSFKIKNGLLLLGVRTTTRTSLYLASKTPTASQFDIKKFKDQTLCFETKYNYFVPGSIREDDDGVEACADQLEKKVPINFRESVGKWILVVSAHKETTTALKDALSSYGETEIVVVNDKVHLSHTSIYDGAINTLDDIEVEESTGRIIYKDSPLTTSATIHSISANCILFSPDGPLMFLNCRANHFPPMGEISQFLKYATCRDFNKILIRQPASFLCSEMPVEVHSLDVEKIAGTWKLAAIASNIPPDDVVLPNEMQFTVKNNKEVTITDGIWTKEAVKVENRRLHYGKSDSVMEMRFYEPLEESLMAWIGNIKEKRISLFLLSKSGNAKPDELTRFKHFAACLSIRVVFLKE
ncbi:uncharacterized protein [Phyllobates terribilis]|uniref:uncharacterized protein n=1 Tax=Phyllobates terribilis TaxID=111132 RepID=UPI003CCADC1C